MQQSESPDSTALRVPKRAYQACIRCRGRKARCIVREPVPGCEPVCLRCKRERKECVYAAERTQKQPGRQSSRFSRSEGLHQSSPQSQQPNSAIGNAWDQLSPSNTARESAAGSGKRSHELTDRLTRTAVSNQTEALNLLFEAADEYQPNDASSIGQPQVEADGPARTPHSTSSRPDSWLYPAENLVSPSAEALAAFSRLRFVKKRWLTALEAITYVQLFYKNMWPLSPIISDHYSHPSNFSQLVRKEPVLCTVILTLSSRYHLLHGDGWLSRSYFLHNRLWRYCHSLLQRVIWGQEKCVVSSTRSLGTVEGLLLMAEWHARSLHFPPDTEAWDSDDDEPERSEVDGLPNVPDRWMEGVLEPMRRSDRMSWALMQAAASLGQELEIFDEAQDNVPNQASDGANAFASLRRRRLRVLLYVYINQLAFRIGFSSLIPHHLLSVPANATKKTSQGDDQWLVTMSLWVDLTKLMRMCHDLLFVSKVATRDLVLSGRYRTVLEHFTPLLENWWTKHSALPVSEPLRDPLSIDFLYTRIHIYSLAVQAAAEQKISQQSKDDIDALSLNLNFHYEGYEFIQGVIDGAKEVLRIVLAFAEAGRLRFLPVRTYVKVIYICILLLKALALGVPADQLNASLGLIDQSARVLRRHTVDDVHLAGVFASLLETYTQGFRARFVSTVNVSRPILNASGVRTIPAGTGDDSMNEMVMEPGVEYGIEHDWFAHPFDSSIAPFGIGFTQPFGGFDDLNFMWNSEM